MRKDKAVLEEERREFVSLGSLKDAEVLDCFDTPDFSADRAQDFDAVFIGGMSDDPSDSVELTVDIFPFIDNLKQLIQYCVDHSIPTFASCGGFQIAAEVIGGEVIVDKEHKEMGCYELTLTGGYEDDPLLYDFPEKFMMISGHNKRVKNLPETCELLGKSELCPVHIFRIKDKPFYAFQFHPEITPKDFYQRVEPYWKKYFATREDFEETARQLEYAHLSNTLIQKFVDRIVLCDNE